MDGHASQREPRREARGITTKRRVIGMHSHQHSTSARMMLAFGCADVFARRSLLKFSVIQRLNVSPAISSHHRAA